MKHEHMYIGNALSCSQLHVSVARLSTEFPHIHNLQMANKQQVLQHFNVQRVPDS